MLAMGFSEEVFTTGRESFCLYLHCQGTFIIKDIELRWMFFWVSIISIFVYQNVNVMDHGGWFAYVKLAFLYYW